MNTLEMKGSWNAAKGKLKKKWARLVHDDLRYNEAEEEELLGRIQKRSGKNRKEAGRAFRKECGCP